MKTTDFLLLILGMTLVTYIPRAIPAVLLEKLSFGGRMEKFLRLIPYTAMAALIFPGVFAVDANPLIGIAGGAVAAMVFQPGVQMELSFGGFLPLVFLLGIGIYALSWYLSIVFYRKREA